jgi:hypothetical protein
VQNTRFGVYKRGRIMSLENEFDISIKCSLHQGRIYSRINEKRNLRNVLDLLVQYLYIHIESKEFYSAAETVYQIDDIINEMLEENINGTTITTISGYSRRDPNERSEEASRTIRESTEKPLC